MSVDANVAYSLSKDSGFGPDLCKMALERTKNDAQAANKLLQKWHCYKNKQGIKTTNTFGAVCAYFDSAFNAASIVKATCNDELCVNTKEFYALVGSAASEVVEYEMPYVALASIEAMQQDKNIKVNVEYERFAKSSKYSLLTTYVHREKIAVMLETTAESPEAFLSRDFRILSHDCALHIAAFDPAAIDKTEMPAALKYEKQIQIEKQLAHDGKDMKFWPSVIDGKLNKWLEQRTLLNQIFIKHDTATVRDVITKVSERVNAKISINRFARFEIV